MSHIREVEVRLASREDLEARGFGPEEIDKILAKQDGEPGEVIDKYTPEPIGKQKWSNFSLK